MYSHPARGLSRPGTQAPVAASPDAGNEPCDSGGGGRQQLDDTFRDCCITLAKLRIRPVHIANLLRTNDHPCRPMDVRILLYNARKTDPTIPKWEGSGRPPALTETQIEWAVNQSDLGWQYRHIGKQLNCSHTTVYWAVKNFRNRGAHASVAPIGGSSCSPPDAPSSADTRSGRAGDGA